LLLSSEEAKAEFEETAKLEILFLIHVDAESVSDGFVSSIDSQFTTFLDGISSSWGSSSFSCKLETSTDEGSPSKVLFLVHSTGKGISENGCSTASNLEHTTNDLSSDGSESTSKSGKSTPLKVFL